MPPTLSTGSSLCLRTPPPFCPSHRIHPGFFHVCQSFRKYLLSTDYLPGCAGDTGNISFLVGLNPIGGR